MTEHAVFKFQQSRELIDEKGAAGAGVFDSKTRAALNTVIASRLYTTRLIAAHNPSSYNPTATVAAAFEEGLSFGASGDQVKQLQEFLAAVGFMEEHHATGFFGDVTRSALISFQKSHKLIDSEVSPGAGRVGPQTKAIIEQFFGSRAFQAS